MSEITTPKIAAAEVTPNRHRGGDIRVLLSPRSVGATSGFMGVATLAPGEYVNEHRHPYSEEFMYVVRGSVVARVDGAELTLRPGEALMVPIDLRHRLENPGTEEAFLIFHASPLAPTPQQGHVDTEPLPGVPDHGGHR